MTNTPNTVVMNKGDLAFLDTLCNGLVPLKVLRIESDTRQDGKPVKHVVAIVTANRGPFRRGDVITTKSPGRIVPRAAVRRFPGKVWPTILPFTVGV